MFIKNLDNVQNLSFVLFRNTYVRFSPIIQFYFRLLFVTPFKTLNPRHEHFHSFFPNWSVCFFWISINFRANVVVSCFKSVDPLQQLLSSFNNCFLTWNNSHYRNIIIVIILLENDYTFFYLTKMQIGFCVSVQSQLQHNNMFASTNKWLSLLYTKSSCVIEESIVELRGLWTKDQ